jgi:RNA polymerase sigma-70 factor (ECF subfamily)
MSAITQSGDGRQCLHAHSDSDAELIRSAQLGCTECFSILFLRYSKLVLTIAWKVLRQLSEVEDLVQEVFLAIFLKVDTYDPARGSVKTWIAQMAYFKALIRRRNLYTRRLTSLEVIPNLEEMLSFEQNTKFACGALCAVDRARLVEQTLAFLNPRQRRTIELIHFDGYTLREAAGVLKESLANTRNQYYRGMKSLRTLLRFPQAVGKIAGVASQVSITAEASDPRLPAAEI